MSPEQCLGRVSQIDHRTDIYSLGVMIFQLLTGRVPYEAEGWGEILVMHLNVPFPLVAPEVPDVSPEFDEVLQKATAKQRENRWESMSEFQDALTQFYDRNYKPPKIAARPRRTGATSLSEASNPASMSSNPGVSNPGLVSHPGVRSLPGVPGYPATPGHASDASLPTLMPSASGSLVAGEVSPSMMSMAGQARPAGRGAAPWIIVGLLVLGLAGGGYALFGRPSTPAEGPGTTGAGVAGRPVTGGPAAAPAAPVAAPAAPAPVAPVAPAPVAPVAPAATATGVPSAPAVPQAGTAPAAAPAAGAAAAVAPAAPTAPPAPAAAAADQAPAPAPTAAPAVVADRAASSAAPRPAARRPRTARKVAAGEPAAAPAPAAPAPRPASNVPLKLKVLE
jgi:hypothetical protein